MAGQKDYLKVGAIALVFIAGAMVYTAGGFQSSLGGGAAPVVSTSGGTCSAEVGSDVKALAEYYDVGQGQNVQVATTAAMYLVGDKSTYASVTTTTTNYTTVGNLNCNQPATLFIGDAGATYYYVQKDLNSGDVTAKNTNVKVLLKKAGAATMTFQNSTSGAWAANVVESGVAAGGETVGSHMVQIRLSSGANYWGDGGFALCADWQSNNVSKVSFGSQFNEIPLVSSISPGSGRVGKCYEYVGDFHANQVLIAPVDALVVPGVTAVASNVTVTLVDKASYLKDGKAIVGYVNADTNANIGLADVQKTVALQIN